MQYTYASIFTFIVSISHHQIELQVLHSILPFHHLIDEVNLKLNCLLLSSLFLQTFRLLVFRYFLKLHIQSLIHLQSKKMFTQLGMCLMFITVIYLNIANTVSATSANMEQSEQKRFTAGLFERFGIDPSSLFGNRPHYGDDVGKGAMFYQKRQSKKKWADFSQRSQSPYTIAFPALIRTRRWIEQEQ